MPFYYDNNQVVTSNVTPNTEDKVLRLLTVANQRTAAVVGLYVAARNTAVGGPVLRLKTAGTAATVGSAATLTKRDPDAPAVGTTAFTGYTAGSTYTTRVIVGCSAQGGQGGWFAPPTEDSIIMKPNGGANGNAEVYDLAPQASCVFDMQLVIAEI